MGLDMYLLAKRHGAKAKPGSTTGACGGLFPLTIDNKGREEIGYWRKAYTVADTIIAVSGHTGDDNCTDIPLDLEMCERIYQATKTILRAKSYEDEWEKNDWEATKEIFEKAIALIKNENAKIVYYQWY